MNIFERKIPLWVSSGGIAFIYLFIFDFFFVFRSYERGLTYRRVLYRHSTIDSSCHNLYIDTVIFCDYSCISF